jgi:hypothetical protein
MTNRALALDFQTRLENLRGATADESDSSSSQTLLQEASTSTDPQTLRLLAHIKAQDILLLDMSRDLEGALVDVDALKQDVKRYDLVSKKTARARLPCASRTLRNKRKSISR